MPDIHQLKPYKLEFINNKMSNFSKSININFDNINIFYETNKHLVFDAKNIEYSKSVC